MKSQVQHVCCLLCNGRELQPLESLLARQVDTHRPRLVFREPAPGRPIGCFQGLAAADMLPPAAGQAQPALVEARLYYEGGLLHLLAEGQATRWAAWLDCGEPRNPPWQGSAPRPAWCPETTVEPGVQTFARTCRPILLRQADLRRGLALAAGLPEKLIAFEYYQHGVLRWWRLETPATT